MGARRVAPVLFLAIGVVALLVWWLVYTQRVVTDLRREAARSSQMYARVYQALKPRRGTTAPPHCSTCRATSGRPVCR